ncbi:MAG: multiheme c-type cytochrome, partial [Bacteroidota bacterium]
MLALLVYFGNMFCYTGTTTAIRNKNTDSLSKKFAGTDACKSCHKAIFDSFTNTAHYFTSRPASETSIKGSFEPGKNIFRYNKWMEVVLQKKDNRFYQQGFISGQEYQTEPFDITIGSGRKGQTYLYWKNSKLFQLPVYWFKPLNTWCNSPGFPSNFMKFDREIHGECLECHTSYSKIEYEGEANEYIDPTGILYGIDCERCHGPAADHVTWHKKHANENKGKYIINANLLNRQQQLDACAYCHSGLRNQVKPTFSFQVGDKLDDFSLPRYNTDSSSHL